MFYCRVCGQPTTNHSWPWEVCQTTGLTEAEAVEKLYAVSPPLQTERMKIWIG